MEAERRPVTTENGRTVTRNLLPKSATHATMIATDRSMIISLLRVVRLRVVQAHRLVRGGALFVTHPNLLPKSVMEKITTVTVKQTKVVLAPQAKHVLAGRTLVNVAKVNRSV